MHFLVLCECGLQQMVKVVHVATRETKRQLHGNTEEGLTPDFCLFFFLHTRSDVAVQRKFANMFRQLSLSNNSHHLTYNMQ